MKVTYVYWIFIIELFEYSSIHTFTFHVSMYGAKPNDNIDDANAIQSTVDLTMRYGPNSIVTFGSGTYNLSAAIIARDAINLTITVRGMDKILLVATVPSNRFVLYTSEQILITSLAIDINPLSFTAGYIVNFTDSYLDLQVQLPHQADNFEMRFKINDWLCFSTRRNSRLFLWVTYSNAVLSTLF